MQILGFAPDIGPLSASEGEWARRLYKPYWRRVVTYHLNRTMLEVVALQMVLPSLTLKARPRGGGQLLQDFGSQHNTCAAGLPWWLSGKESTCHCRRHRFSPWSGKIPHACQGAAKLVHHNY